MKAALLYGDKVTAMSPLLTMLLRVEELGKLKPLELIELMRRVSPYLLPAGEGAAFVRGLEQIEKFLKPGGGGTPLTGRLVRSELRRRLEPARELLTEGVEDLAERSGVTELAAARSKGLLDIQSVDPGDALDLIASCLISAKLAERGENQESPHTNRLVGAYVERLAQHLEAGRNYLIFDRQTASLVEAGLKDGLFRAAPGPSGRAAQAMTASGLLARLPTFPLASLDEIIDIRKGLAGPLTHFRAAMVSAARDFSSEAWSAEFGDELHDLWVERVAPAVQEIDDEVRSNASLVEIAAGVAGTAKATLPGLSLIGAGLAGHAHALTLAGETAAVAVPLLDALRTRRRGASDLRLKPFYFLYSVDAALS